MAISSVLARNVKKFRDDIKLSQAAVAHQAGLSKQTIVDIEAGRANPTVDTLETLAAALGVTIRALISEMGSEVLFQSGSLINWQEQGPLLVRSLDQVYGSGYVHNAVVRLETNLGTVRPLSGTRGMLRHCYVLEGTVELGPEGRTVQACEGDFVRFPGEGPHLFQSVTPSALLFVVTTKPQLSTRALDVVF